MGLGERLSAERDRWPLWAPVFLGLGVAVYFALEREPWLGLGPALALGAFAAALVLRRLVWAGPVLLALGLVAAGLGVAQWRSWWVAAPVLERATGKLGLSGVVVAVEPLPAGDGQRVSLQDVRADQSATKLPPLVRLRLKPGPPVTVGERVAVEALLSPPPPPAFPGAYDFSRDAWFMGLGAVGTALGPVRVLAGAAEVSPGLGLAWLRDQVTRRIRAVLPDDRGGVAAALITGETLAISRPLLAAYRDSGLAHLLSISGLHMSLLAGMVFFVVRGGLALVPAVALYRPIKKWAALVALVVTFAYLLLSGAPVPAQRSFLMTAIALVAVMLDRAALSPRLVAWAAVVVVVLAPESLVGPSFQMSFAAVVALITAYEAATPVMAGWRGGPWWRRALLHVGGLVFTSLVAGSATAFYGAYHFNRFAVWAVLANLLAVPLTGMAVMPFAIAGLLLMPVGLEALALVPMGWGITAVNQVAMWVAGLPLAALLVPPLPSWGVAAFTLGGLWLCLWRGSWRLWGVLPMVIGLAGLGSERPPDVVVDGHGYAFGVRLADDSLLVNRGGRVLRETWERRAGPLAAERWPRQSRNAARWSVAALSDDGSLSCAGKACVYRVDGRAVALILDEDGVEGACATPLAAVVSAVPLRGRCRDAGLRIDRFDLWRKGAHALWAQPGGGWRVVAMVDIQGDRPWSYRPKPRARKVQEEAPSPADNDENDDS